MTTAAASTAMNVLTRQEPFMAAPLSCLTLRSSAIDGNLVANPKVSPLRVVHRHQSRNRTATFTSFERIAAFAPCARASLRSISVEVGATFGRHFGDPAVGD
jgi:hypothetical protein